MIRLFVFDLYGTLAYIRTDENDPRAWLTLATFMRYHSADYEPETLRKRYWELIKEQEKSLAERYGHGGGEIDLVKVYERLYGERGVRLDENMIRITAKVLRAASTLEKFRLYDGTKEMLTALKESGARVALFSNAQDCYTRPELETVGILNLFDKAFISSEYGFKKPSVDFFGALIKWAGSLGISPSEIIMTGNSPGDDIIPARRMGLKTCFVRSALTDENDETPGADIVMEQVNMYTLKKLLLAI